MRRFLLVAACGLAAAAAWSLFARTRAGRQLEWRFYDWNLRLRPPRPWTTPLGPVRIIAIDEESIRVLGKWAWPRLYHAQLLQVLGHPAYRPRAIGYDVAFLQPDRDDPAGDAALEAMARAHGAVCLGYHFEAGAQPREDHPPRDRAAGSDAPGSGVPGDGTPGGDAPGSGPPGGGARESTAPGSGPSESGPSAGSADRAPACWEKVRLSARGGFCGPAWSGARLPWPRLAEAGWLGAINAPADPDGVLRRLPVVFPHRSGAYPSLGLAVALRALGCDPGRVEVVPGRWVRMPAAGGGTFRLPIDGVGRTLVDFPGPWGSAPVTSFVDVLRWALAAKEDGEDTARRALEEFRDAVVFVGMDYSLVPDVVPTPMDEAGWPGVGVHAALAQAILAGRSLREPPRWMQAGLVGLAALAAGALATWPRFRWGVPALFLLLAATLAGGAWAVGRGRVLWTAAPLGAEATAFAGLVMVRQLVIDRRRRRLRRLFSQYLSPAAVGEIVDRADEVALGGRRMQAVVLFCDLRGFTGLTETLGAAAVVEMLNEYFEAMTEVVQRHGGAVNKFVGDGILATFGVPVPHPDDTLRAARAAVQMQRRMADLRRTWGEQGRPRLRMGVGISRGEVLAGSIGSDRRRDYTVIGDPVNLASRLQELTRELDEEVLVCGSVWEDLAGSLPGRPLGTYPVRGRSKPVPVAALNAAR